MDRSQRLFKDWISTLNKKRRNEVLENIKTQRGVFAYKYIIEEMGLDGDTLNDMFLEQKSLTEDSKTAKEQFCRKLLEAAEKKEVKSDIADYIHGGLNDEGYNHYAVLNPSGIGNSIDGDIEISKDGLFTGIIRAITGGNMAIAAQLTAVGWGSLSPADKMAIYNHTMVHGMYGQTKIGVSETGEAKFYVKQMKKEIEKGSIGKEDFIKKAFPRSDISLLKI